jgi:hypothetical protein
MHARNIKSNAFIIATLQTPLIAHADTGIGPHLFSIEFWATILPTTALIFIAIAFFNLAVAIFAITHAILVALILLGVWRKRFWKRGISICLATLVLGYAALFMASHHAKNVSISLTKPNWAFNVDANSGHAFGIFMAAVGALRPSASGAS